MRTHENPWPPKIIYNWWLLRSPHLAYWMDMFKAEFWSKVWPAFFFQNLLVDLANCYCVIGRGSHIYSMIYEM